MKLLLSPHNDDAELFACLTLLRHEGNIIYAVVFDSHRQYQRGTGITAGQRREETRRAAKVLGVPDINLHFLGVSDAHDEDIYPAIARFDVDEVFAPAIEQGGHPQHNRVGEVADSIWQSIPVTHYMTYTNRGKSTGSRRVEYKREWIIRKWQALACYGSQIALENCHEHFMRDQHEYYE